MNNKQHLDALTDGPLMTADEAASILKCTRMTVYNLCKRGDIKATRVASTWRINTKSLKAYAGID